MSFLKKYYYEELREKMKEELSLENIQEVPRMEKIVVSMGVGKATEDKNILKESIRDLSMITGQKPIVTKAKKSVSNFKIRKGADVGLKVTMRGRRMFEFMERFFGIAVPRIRDFRGFSTDAFDGYGNYNVGVREHAIFPEIEVDKIKYSFGMNITFVTKSKNDKHAFALLTGLGLPFKK
ncbi:MAG: 50S ribosomal protein L5 [bacterium]